MTIYGEFLFIENYIITFILLFLTSLLIGETPRYRRLLIVSFMGAISSFMILLECSFALSLLLRIIIAFLCVALSFGLADMIIKTAIYFTLTFLSGGIVMALLLWMQESAINHQGVVYMESITYFKLLSLGIIAFGFTYWFIKLIRKKRVGNVILGKVKLEICGRVYELKGYVDSGNYLKEPISGKGVILIDKKGAEQLGFEPKKIPSRYVLIPYNSVGIKNGVLEGTRLDRVIYRDCIAYGVYLAFYQGYFDGYEVLLNKDFLEGGLLEENNKSNNTFF